MISTLSILPFLQSVSMRFKSSRLSIAVDGLVGIDVHKLPIGIGADQLCVVVDLRGVGMKLVIESLLTRQWGRSAIALC